MHYPILLIWPILLLSNYTIEEAIKMSKNGRQYRATLRLRIYGEIDEGPFSGLLELLVRASESLFAETGERGLGTLTEKGRFEELEFEAWWTWYEVLDGGARRCGDSRHLAGRRESTNL
jgi:hypothetical protein